MQDMKYMFQDINSFNGLIDNLIEHKKELVNLKTVQQKLSKMKHTEKKQTGKTMEQSILRLMGQNQMIKICVIGVQGKERKNGAEETFEKMMNRNFPELMEDIEEAQQALNGVHTKKFPSQYLIDQVP